MTRSASGKLPGGNAQYTRPTTRGRVGWPGSGQLRGICCRATIPILLVGALACTRTPEPEPFAAPLLPALPVSQAAESQFRSDSIVPPYSSRIDTGAELGEPITLSAIDADVRTVLPLLARAAGVSLVLGPEIEGRITVHFEQVPARAALQAALDAAGFGLMPDSVAVPWGPTRFYALPFHLDTADAEALQARFGVSEEMARWIIENRF